MLHIVIDRKNGEAMIQAPDGRQVPWAHVEEAQHRARGGDADAQAWLDALEIAEDGGVLDMQQLLHDCPECRAAMARGEAPAIFGPGEIEALREMLAAELADTLGAQLRRRRRAR